MLIALLSTNAGKETQVTREIIFAASNLFKTRFVTLPNVADSRRLSMLADDIERHNPSILTIYGNIKAPEELDLMRGADVAVCLIHGRLNPIFTRHERPILKSDIYVVPLDDMDSLPTSMRRQYMTPEEAYSEAYSRYRGFSKVSA